jgi:hypothetical protein
MNESTAIHSPSALPPALAMNESEEMRGSQELPHPTSSSNHLLEGVFWEVKR